MICNLAQRLPNTREICIPGSTGINKSYKQELWRLQVDEITTLGFKQVWCHALAPCLEFGIGTMFYAGNMAIGEGTILWLIAPNNRYYNLDKYKRVGNPPMITILNPPANWTLENGELTYENRDHIIQIPSRYKA